MKKYLSFALSLILVFALLFSLSSCSDVTKETKDDKTVFATVGKYEVSKAFYNTLHDGYMEQYTGGEKVTDEAEKAALEEKVKSAVEADLKSFFAVYSAAEEYGVDLENCAASVEAYIKEFRIENILNEDKTFAASLEEAGMTYAVFAKYCERDIVSEALFEKLVEDKVIDAEEEDLVTLANNGEIIRTKHILIPFEGTDVTYKEILDPALLKNSNAYKKICEAKTKLDAGESFESLISEYGKDVSLFKNDDGHYISKGNKEVSYENAAFALEENQTGDIVETSEGYCIIKRLPAEEEYLEKNGAAVVSQHRAGLFNIITEEFAGKLTVTFAD